MPPSREERGAQKKWKTATKRFFLSLASGLILLFVSFTLLVVPKFSKNSGLRVGGIFCGGYGALLMISAFIYLYLEWKRYKSFQRSRADASVDYVAPTTLDSPTVDNNLHWIDRSNEGNDERPPSYTTCVVKDASDLPSYSEVIAYINEEHKEPKMKSQN